MKATCMSKVLHKMNGGVVTGAGISGRVYILQYLYLVVLFPEGGLFNFLLDSEPNPIQK